MAFTPELVMNDYNWIYKFIEILALVFQPFPSSTSIHANENIQSKKR